MKPLWICFKNQVNVPEGSYIINLSTKFSTESELHSIISSAIAQVRDKLLEARNNGISVTLILPDDALLAISLFQGVRALLGRTPYIAMSDSLLEVNVESIKEAFQESL